MSTPSLPAPPMPAKKLKGILITSAQGQLITRKVSALYIQLPGIGSSPMTSLTTGGMIASANAL